MGVDHDAVIRFVRLILSLQRGGSTGVLEVRGEPDRKARLSFWKGQLVHAEHKSLGGTLGAHLVERGKLTREQYVEIAKQIHGKTMTSPMMTFVERAVSRRLIEVEDANALLQGQVERNFISLFDWEGLEAVFAADEMAVVDGPRFPCEVEALVLEGIRRKFDPAAVERHLGSRMSQYPKLLGAPSDLVAVLRLEPREMRLLKRLDGGRSVAELLDVPEPERTQLARLLLALKLSQRIEWRESEDERGEEFDSEPMVRVPLAALRLERAPSSVQLLLPDPPSAEAIEAASRFREGVALFRAGKLHDASARIREAVTIVDKPEYRLYAVWLQTALGNRAPDADTAQALADAARAALERDPTLAFAYFVVGQVHLMQGDRINAQLAFRRAAKLDPTDDTAQHAIDAMRR
jgi:tetratricopeptide (TPR) repeat protein